MEDIKEVSIIIKWSGKEYPITDLTEHCTVAILKHEIMKKTQVRPERQKLLNLKYKGKSFFFFDIFRCFCLKSHGFVIRHIFLFNDEMILVKLSFVVFCYCLAASLCSSKHPAKS